MMTDKQEKWEIKFYEKFEMIEELEKELLKEQKG